MCAGFRIVATPHMVNDHAYAFRTSLIHSCGHDAVRFWPHGHRARKRCVWNDPAGRVRERAVLRPPETKPTPERRTPHQAWPRSRSVNRCRPRAAPSGVSMHAERASFAPRSTDARRQRVIRSARADIERAALRTISASPSTAIRSRRPAVCPLELLATGATRAIVTTTGSLTNAWSRGAPQRRATPSSKPAALSRRRVTSSKIRQDAGRWAHPSSARAVLASHIPHVPEASPAPEHVRTSAEPMQTARAE